MRLSHLTDFFGTQSPTQHWADRWLDPDTPVDELRALLKPFPAEMMKAIPVNRAVNSVKNDDERCIEPVEVSDESAILL